MDVAIKSANSAGAKNHPSCLSQLVWENPLLLAEYYTFAKEEKEHNRSATSEGRTKDLWEFYRIWNHKLVLSS